MVEIAATRGWKTLRIHLPGTRLVGGVCNPFLRPGRTDPGARRSPSARKETAFVLLRAVRPTNRNRSSILFLVEDESPVRRRVSGKFHFVTFEERFVVASAARRPLVNIRKAITIQLKTMRLPSGDQPGAKSLAASKVKRVRMLRANSISRMSEFTLWSTQANATRSHQGKARGWSGQRSARQFRVVCPLCQTK